MTDTIQARTPDGSMPVRRLKARRRAKARATLGGYFWHQCITCGQWHGGHEWTTGRGVPHRPPLFPDVQERTSHGLCPACLDAGVHVTWMLAAPGLISVYLEDLDGPMGTLLRDRFERPA